MATLEATAMLAETETETEKSNPEVRVDEMILAL
jgi:hypothetical protein